MPNSQFRMVWNKQMIPEYFFSFSDRMNIKNIKLLGEISIDNDCNALSYVYKTKETNEVCQWKSTKLLGANFPHPVAEPSALFDAHRAHWMCRYGTQMWGFCIFISIFNLPDHFSIHCLCFCWSHIVIHSKLWSFFHNFQFSLIIKQFF